LTTLTSAAFSVLCEAEEYRCFCNCSCKARELWTVVKTHERNKQPSVFIHKQEANGNGRDAETHVLRSAVCDSKMWDNCWFMSVICAWVLRLSVKLLPPQTPLMLTLCLTLLYLLLFPVVLSAQTDRPTRPWRRRRPPASAGVVCGQGKGQRRRNPVDRNGWAPFLSQECGLCAYKPGHTDLLFESFIASKSCLESTVLCFELLPQLRAGQRQPCDCINGLR